MRIYKNICNTEVWKMKDKRIALRLDDAVHDKIKAISPEGRVSMWIRMLIERELKKLQEPK